jgi:hypothetical protein
MLREGEPGSLEQPAGYFGSVANSSMVPWQVHGGTMVLPGPQEGARCHSQYCECLYKPYQIEGSSQKTESVL